MAHFKLVKVQKGVTNFITHSTMEPSNFASLDAEVANDISGTEFEPRLVRVLTGKCGAGVVFVIKIGNLYFEMWQKNTAKKWILLRCCRWRPPEKCCFTAKVVNLGNLQPEDDGFFSTTNWAIQRTDWPTSSVHSTKRKTMSDNHSRRARLSVLDRSICYKNLRSTNIFTIFF